MRLGKRPLKETIGLDFFKLMGTGKYGFSVYPDWSQYALLSVWKDEIATKNFFRLSPIYQSYKSKCDEITNYHLTCVKSHGNWDGIEPFFIDANFKMMPNTQIGVITRASVKPRFLFKFWKYVPKSHQTLYNNPGLIFSTGIGDKPFLEMATFSLWQNQESILNFAYKDDSHKKAIALTKKHKWYSEELFARFAVRKITF
jgi:heme-degrading monooxygenase HmoA